jgi:hypothetical protein
MIALEGEAATASAAPMVVAFVIGNRVVIAPRAAPEVQVAHVARADLVVLAPEDLAALQARAQRVKPVA